jgi:intraflagellar transport protein 172
MQMWENAVRLAMNYVPDRAPDVVGVVSQRLVEIKRYGFFIPLPARAHPSARHDQAAELWLGIDRFKEAIDVYCRSGLVEKARRVAAQMAPQLADYVEKLAGDARPARPGADIAASVAAAAATGGGSQLEALVAQDRWPEVMQQAASQGAAVEQKYAVVFAARMLTLSKAR